MGTWAHYGVTQRQEWNLSSAILELVLASKVDFHWLAVTSNNGDLLGKKWLNQKMSIFGFEGRRLPLVEEELGGAASSSWPRAERQESVSPGEQNSIRSNIK